MPLSDDTTNFLRNPAADSGGGVRFSTMILVWTLSSVFLAVVLFFAVTGFYGRRAEESRTDLLLGSTISRLEDRVRRMTSDVAAQAEIASMITPRRALTEQDVVRVFPELARAFYLNPDLSYLGFALERTGEYWMLQRLPSGEISLKTYTGLVQRNIQVKLFRWDGQVFRFEEEIPWDGYDPRQRPFYKFAVESGRSGWTSSYSFWALPGEDPGMGISFVSPIYALGEGLVGVWDSDIDAASLTRILWRLRDELPGTPFVFERRPSGWSPVVNPVQYVEPALFESIGSYLDGLAPETLSGGYATTMGGVKYMIRIKMMEGPAAPRWMLGTAVAWDEVSRHNVAQTRWLWFAALGMLAGSIPIAIMVSRHVSRPLRVLESRIADLPGSGSDAPETSGGPAELRRVAYAFAKMARQVRRQREQLTTVNERLLAEIAEREISSRKLAESETRFATAFQAGPVPMAIVREADGIFVDANDAWLTLFGLPYESVIGGSIVETGALSGADRWAALLDVVCRDGLARDFPSAIRRGDGAQRSALLSARRSELNDIRCLILTCVDITEDERRVREIESTQQRFRAAFTYSPVAKLLLRRDSGRVETVNTAAESMLGVGRAGLTGRSLSEAGLQSDTGGASLLEAVRERRRLRNCEVRLKVAREEFVDCLAYLEPVRFGDEEMLLVAFVDVTESRQAAAAIRENENRLRRLNEVSLEINRSISGRVTDPAEACRSLTRGACEALCVSRVSAWRLDRKRGVMVCLAVHETATGRHTQGGELSLRECPVYSLALGAGRVIASSDAQTDPRTRELNEYLQAYDIRSTLDAPVRQRGDLVGVVCVEQAASYRRWTADEESFVGNLADLLSLAFEAADRGEAEEKLRQLNSTLEQRVSLRTAELMAANEKLKELDRLKSEFLATMSHELRTPLNSIIGFTGIIKAGMAGPVNAEQKRQLEMVYGSAGHLLHLINDLLDVSRIESGRVDMDITGFDALGVMEEVAALLQPPIRAKGLSLVIAAPVRPLMLRTDRKRLFQIVLNLASNAVKFTERGNVMIEAVIGDGLLRVSVVDTGVGIRRESIGMLFEAFRQVDGSARRVYEGTGLGLYLCRKLVTLLGGEIGVESEFGRGSRFSFHIPVAGPPPQT